MKKKNLKNKEITVFFLIRLDVPLEYIKSENLKMLMKNPEIIDVYEITGGYDLLIKVKLHDIDRISEMLKLIKIIGGVKNVTTILSSMIIKENGKAYID